MAKPTRWRDVKAEAQTADPAWDAPERQARRGQMREQMLASVSGAQLAEIRKQLGLTQTQLAEATGLSQARISQIENGTATTLETLRAYVTGVQRTPRHRRSDRQHPPQRRPNADHAAPATHRPEPLAG
jgi:DNA-binding XRE family transcriptional regulator